MHKKDNLLKLPKKNPLVIESLRSPLESVRKSFLSPVSDTPRGKLTRSIETSKKRMTALRNIQELRKYNSPTGTDAGTVLPGMGNIEEGIPSLMSHSIDADSFVKQPYLVRPSDRVSFRQSFNEVTGSKLKNMPRDARLGLQLNTAQGSIRARP